jgi:hypothetical protein
MAESFLLIHGVDVTRKRPFKRRRAAGAKKKQAQESQCHFILICFRILVLAILESGSVCWLLSGLLF